MGATVLHWWCNLQPELWLADGAVVYGPNQSAAWLSGRSELAVNHDVTPFFSDIK